MGKITLDKMQFYAHHGHFDEEQLVGAYYEVSLSLHFDTLKAALSDNLEDTINYQEVYSIVKTQMEENSRLIEHVSQRIIDSVMLHFPQLSQVDLSFSKLNPPLGGQVERVTIELSASR